MGIWDCWDALRNSSSYSRDYSAMADWLCSQPCEQAVRYRLIRNWKGRLLQLLRILEQHVKLQVHPLEYNARCMFIFHILMRLRHR